MVFGILSVLGRVPRNLWSILGVAGVSVLPPFPPPRNRGRMLDFVSLLLSLPPLRDGGATQPPPRPVVLKRETGGLVPIPCCVSMQQTRSRYPPPPSVESVVSNRETGDCFTHHPIHLTFQRALHHPLHPSTDPPSP